MNILKLSLTAAHIPLDELIKSPIKCCCEGDEWPCTLHDLHRSINALPLNQHDSLEGKDKQVTSTHFRCTNPNSASALLPYDYATPLFIWWSHLVKNPDLPIDGGPRDSVAIVVKQDSLLFGVASQRCAQLLHLIDGGVQALLVARLRNDTDENVV